MDRAIILQVNQLILAPYKKAIIFIIDKFENLKPNSDCYSI